jgi:methylphosphotriester-DNA--protein-cysteine methyltransferase
MARTGRPKKEFDKKIFQDLVGLGCTQEEICWFFRDETGKSANIDTLTRWCKREFDMTFQEYFRQNGCMMLKIQLRRNQLKLSGSSAAMAIFLGKNYLGQTDKVEQTVMEVEDLSSLAEMLRDNAPAENEGNDANSNPTDD